MHGEAGPHAPLGVATAFGFDLFNHGYYWEAHEAWERRWVAENRQGALADLLKGLIKLAAAGVKARAGKPAGVRRHARRAEELFQASTQLTDPELPNGWRRESAAWAGHARRVYETPAQWIDIRSEPVVVVFDFTLAMPQP